MQRLIDETPLWLWASGREKKAEDVLQKVAKYNGKPTQTTEDLQEVLHKDEKNAPAGFCIVVKELATSCTMMLRCVVTAISWYAAIFQNIYITADVQGCIATAFHVRSQLLHSGAVLSRICCAQ